MARAATKRAATGFDALTPEEQDELLALTEDRYGGEGLHDFIVRMKPREPPPRHLAPLIDVFERARHGPVRVCVSMPPRHAKTETVIRAIAWWLSRNPADTCAYTSYSDHQAWSKSLKARRLAVEAGVELDPDKNSVSEWRTIHGGGLLASGVGGPLTGQGVTGFLIIDDPVKNRREAESSVMREHIWEWFQDVAKTRLEGPASMIVLHTRWHEDDLIGRLKDEGWEVINLCALAEPYNDNGEPEKDPIGRQPGEALWPERFPVKVLEEKRKGNEYGFCSLYQGRPRPRGSKLFKEPGRFNLATLDITGKVIKIGADPAASEDATADYSAAVVMAQEIVLEKGKILLDDEGLQIFRYYVIYVRREQAEVPKFCRDLLGIQLKFGAAPAFVETVAGFKAVPQVMRTLEPKLRVFGFPMQGDKFLNAQPLSKAWNTGRVLVPDSLADAPWLKDYLKEMSEFTGVKDKKDDQVDATAAAFNAFRKGTKASVGMQVIGS